MSRLFAKIDSDIRHGIGCRGESEIKTTIFYNFDGSLSPQGQIITRVEHNGDNVEITVLKFEGEAGEELVNITIPRVSKEAS